MTWAHGLGAALLFLGSTAAGFALRRELQQRAQRPAVLRAMGGGDPGTGHAHAGRARRAADIGRAAWKI